MRLDLMILNKIAREIINETKEEQNCERKLNETKKESIQ